MFPLIHLHPSSSLHVLHTRLYESQSCSTLERFPPFGKQHARIEIVRNLCNILVREIPLLSPLGRARHNGRIILKCVLKIGFRHVKWAEVIHNCVQLRAFQNTVKQFGFHVFFTANPRDNTECNASGGIGEIRFLPVCHNTECRKIMVGFREPYSRN
jgi:hypothetical protein